MCSPSISCWCDIDGLHSKGTVESDRTVCTIQAALSRAGLGTPEPQTAGQVQTPLKESLGSHHLEECTGADTRQQSIPANTWSVWHFAGLMPMTGSCGIVFGCHATKERSPLSWGGFFRPVFGLAVRWPNKSLYTLLLINRIPADGCVITLLLWWAWHGYPVGY